MRDRDPVPLEDAESESPPQVFGSRPKAWTSPERDETVTSDSSKYNLSKGAARIIYRLVISAASVGLRNGTAEWAYDSS